MYSTKPTTRRARRVTQKPVLDSQPEIQPVSRDKIIDLLEQSVSKAGPELPDRCRSQLTEQLAVIKKDFAQSSVTQPAQKTLLVITTPEQLDQLEAEIQLEKQAVFVLATTGDDHQTDRLLGIAVTVGTQDYYIPLWHQFPGGQLLPDQLAPTLLANRFSLAGVKFITHDAKTVIHFLRHHVGISVQFSHDIMIAAMLLAEHEHYDLNTLRHHLPGKSVSDVPALSLDIPQHQSIEAIAKIMAERCHVIMEIYRSQQ